MLGGRDGVSGNGGTVTIDYTMAGASIITQGTESAAIFAQSIGGGGGMGQGGLDGASGNNSGTSVSGGKTPDGNGEAPMGDGGTVMVSYAGTISTAETATDAANTAAFGIFAQSVGGGGGYAGSVVLGPTSRFGSGQPMASNSDTSGDGGPVTVTASGPLTTRGGASVGIFAQSVGGGGGVAGTANSTDVTGAHIGNGGGSGKGGQVMVTWQGSHPLQTSGAGAHGIFAQSVGGPGTTTTSDTQVTVTADASVLVSGAGAHGIYAQSAGDGMGAIDATVNAGATIQGGAVATIAGAEDGAGVFIKGGTGSTLTNNGTIGALSGIAVNAKETSLDLTNNGTINGSILKASSIYLQNSPTGVIVAGPLLDVDWLVNSGTLLVGEQGEINFARLTGDLLQTRSGVLSVDLNLGDATGDLLSIDGAAYLDGQVKLNLVLPQGAAGLTEGARVVEVIHAGGGITLSDGLTLTRSAVAQYRLVPQPANSLAIGYDIDFDNEGIRSATNRSQDTLVAHLDDLFRAGKLGSVTPDETLQLLAIETDTEYASAANSLSGEIYADGQLSTLYSALRFGDSLMSCAVRDGELRFVREGQCGWFRTGGGWFNQDANARGTGFDQTSWQFAGGAQYEIAEDTHIGFAASYELKSLEMDGLAGSNGDQVQLGVVAKRRFGAAMLAASVSGGAGWFDATRLPFTGETIQGDQTVWNVSSQLRGSYTFEGESWFVKPRLDAGVDYLAAGSVHELGSRAFDLTVEHEGNAYFSLQPALEFGGEIRVTETMLARPKASIGVTQFLGGNAPSARSRFEISPTGSYGFRAKGQLDKTYLDLAAGVEILASDGVSLSAAGFGSVSRNTESFGGQLRVEINF